MNTRRQRRERGQGLLEFAVIFPLFIILLLVVVDGGLVMGHSNNIQNSAKEGARLGAVGASSDEIAKRVTDAASGLDSSTTVSCGAPGTHICIEWIDGPNGEPAGTIGSSVRVKVVYAYQLLSRFNPTFGVISGIGLPAHWNITSCAVQRMERDATGSITTGSGTGC